MRISYHEDTDSLYIHLKEAPTVESEEVAPDTVLHFDEDGNVTGLEIYSEAGKRVDTSKLEVSGLEGGLAPIARAPDPGSINAALGMMSSANVIFESPHPDSSLTDMTLYSGSNLTGFVVKGNTDYIDGVIASGAKVPGLLSRSWVPAGFDLAEALKDIDLEKAADWDKV
jgi:uncharacterized protein YuzE